MFVSFLDNSDKIYKPLHGQSSNSRFMVMMCFVANRGECIKNKIKLKIMDNRLPLKERIGEQSPKLSGIYHSMPEKYTHTIIFTC